MIVISGVLVVLALVLLIAGVLADSLPLIYLSIATSAVSFLSLVFGVRQRKDEQVPGSATAVSASSRSTEARSGGSVALLERPDAPPAPERSAPPTLADTAVVGGSRGSAQVEHPAAGMDRPDDREAETGEQADGQSPEPSTPPAVEAEQEPAYGALEEYDDEEYDDYEGYEEEATEGIVLVINGRPRYHVEDCRFVAGKDAEAIAVEDAREEGFTACGVCRPDEALAAAAELYEDEDEEYDEDEPVDSVEEPDAAEEPDPVEEPAMTGGAPVAGPRDLAVVPGVTAVAEAPLREQHTDDELAEYADAYDEYDEEEYAEADEDGYADSEDGTEPEFEEAYEDEAEPVQVAAAPRAGEPAVAGPAAEAPVLADRTLEDQLLEDPALEDDVLEDDEDLTEPATAATVPPLEPVVPPAPPRVRRMAAAGEAATGARPSPRRTAGARPAGGRPGATRRPSRAAAPSPVPDEVPAPPPRTSTRGRVVVIPDRGRFHRPECRYVRDSPDALEITKNRANKQGYVPCGVCKP